MCNLKTPGFEGVEVACNSTSAVQFQLPVDQVLQRAAKILAIEAYRVTNVAVSGQSGSALQSDTVFKSSFLVLLDIDNNSPIYRIPLTDLDRTLNNGMLFEVDINRINIPASYIYCPGQSANLDTAKVWYLGFHYRKP